MANTAISVFTLDVMYSFYSVIRLTDNKLIYHAFNNEADNEEYDITWEKINKVDYITFNYTGKFLDDYQYENKRPVSQGVKRYLVLYDPGDENGHGDFFYLYDNNNQLVYRQLSRASANFFIPADFSINATSELKEGNIMYGAKNLLEGKKLLPWAEGSNGSGIGARISLEYNTETGGVAWDWIPKWKIFALFISNGFVDYNRPYLYENNNRIKKMRIYFDYPNDFTDVELQDTPQIQIFRFYERRNTKIQLEILEVYQGDKYDDTCVNNIYPFADFYY